MGGSVSGSAGGGSSGGGGKSNGIIGQLATANSPYGQQGYTPSNNTQGGTPLGGTPQWNQNPYQPQYQQASFQPQYQTGSYMGGFGGGFNPYAQQFMQPQFGGFGGKSSGYGQMGMMNSPYGQMGFNPYGGGYGSPFGGGYGKQMGGGFNPYAQAMAQQGMGGGFGRLGGMSSTFELKPEQMGQPRDMGTFAVLTPQQMAQDIPDPNMVMQGQPGNPGFTPRQAVNAPSMQQAMGSVSGLGGLMGMLRGRGFSPQETAAMGQGPRAELQSFFNKGGKVDE